jgi:hypothetical protein
VVERDEGMGLALSLAASTCFAAFLLAMDRAPERHEIRLPKAVYLEESDELALTDEPLVEEIFLPLVLFRAVIKVTSPLAA